MLNIIKLDSSVYKIRIGGIVPFTTIDYPNLLSIVVFCQGCPLRCFYCQNEDLLPIKNSLNNELSFVEMWNNFLYLIKKRVGFIEAIVFSGGEPLMQKKLGSTILIAKNLGYKIGIHTSGAFPGRLEKLLDEKLIDWVGLDIKAPFDKYHEITGVIGSGVSAEESLNLLIKNEIEFECRTTVDPRFLSKGDIIEIVKELSKAGVKNYAIQECLNSEREAFENDFFTNDFLNELKKYFKNLIVRKS